MLYLIDGHGGDYPLLLLTGELSKSKEPKRANNSASLAARWSVADIYGSNWANFQSNQPCSHQQQSATALLVSLYQHRPKFAVAVWSEVIRPEGTTVTLASTMGVCGRSTWWKIIDLTYRSLRSRPPYRSPDQYNRTCGAPDSSARRRAVLGNAPVSPPPDWSCLARHRGTYLV
jgi:hypothetical protein